MDDFLKPSLFDGIIKSLRLLSDAEEIEGDIYFKKPSNARKSGSTLTKCCDVLHGEADRNGNEEKKKDAKRLENLITKEWKHKITAIATRSEKEIKRNKPVILPTGKDLVKLKDFLEQEVKRCSSDLRRTPECSSAFQNLQAAVLCRIIMFNRRRSGEASKMLLKDFVDRPTWQSHLLDEMLKSLTPLEKQLVHRFVDITTHCCAEKRSKSGSYCKSRGSCLNPDLAICLLLCHFIPPYC